MSNENYPVFQTAKLLRVLIPSREGKKGQYAVGLGEHDGHEYTILFCSETFPLDVLNKIIGKIIRVDPTNERGLRAVDFKNQDFEVFKENLEDTAIEVQKLHVKHDNSENRAVQRHDACIKEIQEIKEELEKVKAVIICAYANDENEWSINRPHGNDAGLSRKIRRRLSII